MGYRIHKSEYRCMNEEVGILKVLKVAEDSRFNYSTVLYFTVLKWLLPFMSGHSGPTSAQLRSPLF